MIYSKRIRSVGHAALIGNKRNTCKILEEKPEGKRLLRRSRHIGE
jgi:hypothetical protein